MIWRLLRHSSPDAGMNEALEEAVLKARVKEQPLDTVRIWQNIKTVILGSNVDFQATVNKQECEKNKVMILRRSTSGKTMFQDHCTLNLTYVMDQKEMFPDSENLTEVYKRLCEPVAEGLSKLGVDVKVGDYGQGMFINDGKVSEVWVGFYYNLLLFQISININTDLSLLSQILKRKDRFTTLSKELNKPIGIKYVEGILIKSISEVFEVSFEKQSLLPSEKKLAEKLYAIKYSKTDWNLDMKAPLTLKDILVDVYVAYPPTMSCRRIIENVNSVISDIRDRVELRIWMRGKGLNGEGVPPGIVMPEGLIKASKESIIPAVIINGQISFSRDVPSREDLKDEISKVLRSSI